MTVFVVVGIRVSDLLPSLVLQTSEVYVVVEAAAVQAKRYRTRVRILAIIVRIVMESLLVS